MYTHIQNYIQFLNLVGYQQLVLSINKNTVSSNSLYESTPTQHKLSYHKHSY